MQIAAGEGFIWGWPLSLVVTKRVIGMVLKK